jgi:predicted transcriptional regulator
MYVTQLAQWRGMLFQSARIQVVDDSNIAIAAEIVAAYVSNNSVAASDLAQLLGDVYAALQGIANGPPAPLTEVKLVPAVPIRKSVTPDFIISLEDGKKFKSLKRHLSAAYGMTPEEYRAKWGLPADYPIVAPNYAAQRSALAKTMGLGQPRRRTPRGKANKK